MMSWARGLSTNGQQREGLRSMRKLALPSTPTGPRYDAKLLLSQASFDGDGDGESTILPASYDDMRDDAPTREGNLLWGMNRPSQCFYQGGPPSKKGRLRTRVRSLKRYKRSKTSCRYLKSSPLCLSPTCFLQC